LGFIPFTQLMTALTGNGEAAPRTAAKPRTEQVKAEPWEATIRLTAKAVTGGDRIKYDSGTVKDGDAKGAQGLLYLPPSVARENVEITIRATGRGV